MNKTVIAIDLNPLSRTSQRATIPVVDELTRALRNIEKFVNELKFDPADAARVRRSYRKEGNLRAVFSFLQWRLDRLRRGSVLRPSRRRKGTSKRKA
jgi:4-phosphopantoate--beta-alanine ligase